jgi:hypothetical protein
MMARPAQPEKTKRHHRQKAADEKEGVKQHGTTAIKRAIVRGSRAGYRLFFAPRPARLTARKIESTKGGRSLAICERFDAPLQNRIKSLQFSTVLANCDQLD